MSESTISSGAPVRVNDKVFVNFCQFALDSGRASYEAVAIA